MYLLYLNFQRNASFFLRDVKYFFMDDILIGYSIWAHPRLTAFHACLYFRNPFSEQRTLPDRFVHLSQHKPCPVALSGRAHAGDSLKRVVLRCAAICRVKGLVVLR